MTQPHNNRYQDVFASYAPALEGEALKSAIHQILEAEMPQANCLEVKKFLHGTIDLTTLSGADTETKVARLVQQVNDYDGSDETVPNVAAICVYPNFVPIVRELLTAEHVQVACVGGGFPASQSFIEVKVAEVALAANAGADEVDVVLNLGKFLEEDYQETATELDELKAACRDAHLKVILETGALPSQEAVRQASIIALHSGADFIKTSTGKEYAGASLEAAYTMCQVIKEYYHKYGERRGVKFSGGIRTADEALGYYCLVKHILGPEWLTPSLMRIGASSLVDNLRREIL